MRVMRSKAQAAYWLMLSSLLSMPASASVSLGSGGSGVFAKIGRFLQSVVDFLGGTGTLFVIFLSAAGAIFLWVIAPKAGGEALAWLFRVCVGAIAMFSLSLVITWLKGF